MEEGAAGLAEAKQPLVEYTPPPAAPGAARGAARLLGGHEAAIDQQRPAASVRNGVITQ